MELKNSTLDNVDELWIYRLYAWADKNDIGDLIWIESLGEYVGLPRSKNKLLNLTTLNLDQNQLTELPPEIGQLTSLTKLHLSFNQLTELPPEIGQLTNLTRLHLAKNQFTELPEEILNLPSLDTEIRENLIAMSVLK